MNRQDSPEGERSWFVRYSRSLANASSRLFRRTKPVRDLSFASHQLRAPLAAMKGYSSLLLEGEMGELPPKAKEGVERIYASITSLSEIVEDYLTVSHLEQGAMKYVFERVDLKHLVEEIVAEFRPTIDKKGLKFAFTAVDSETGHHVRADRNKMRQVITNLIDNSITYTPEGEISVSLIRGPKGDSIIFAIQDTGIGIAPASLPHLFKKFSRTDAATKVHTKGTGLGLYIAREIILAHKGTIRAESEGEGRGARFILELEPFGKA